MKKNPHKNLFIWITYGILILILTFYSFSQVDLNLTLSNNSFYQIFQNQLTQLGYYQRPVSAGIFLILVIMLFCLYFRVLDKTNKGETGLKGVMGIIGVSLILIFAYPAFSHDIFNYMFDARIVTHYGLSPYFFKGLDFPLDSWTRFMHWTHRYYPYGPVWLWLSLIPSFIGMGKFVLTLGLFKIMFAGCHLLNCWLIYKIVNRIDKNLSLSALSFYALNPLVITESIISPHNEVIMLTLALLFLFLLNRKKHWLAGISIVASIFIKYISIVLLPVIFFIKKFDLQKTAVAGFYLWTIFLIFVIFQRSVNPWYFIPVIGLAAIAVKSKITRIISVGISGAAIITYWPFLLLGDYGNLTFTFKRWGMLSVFIICSLGYAFFSRERKNAK